MLIKPMKRMGPTGRVGGTQQPEQKIGEGMKKPGRTVRAIAGWFLLAPMVLSCSLLSELPAFTDGCYFGYARAWIDENGNGLREAEEQPLAGVVLELKAAGDDHDYLTKAVTGEEGEFFISAFPNTCKSLQDFSLVLRAIPPDGYRLTTPAAVAISKDDLLGPELQEFLFGFQRQVE